MGKGQGRAGYEASEMFVAKSAVGRGENSAGFHSAFSVLTVAVVPGRRWKAKPAQKKKCQNNQWLPPGRWILQCLSVMGDSAHRASRFMSKM